MSLLQFTDKGIYCAKADVYLDPWKPVQKALITHGHSDHARWGHAYYLCTNQAAPVIKHRLQLHDTVESIAFGETLSIHGVQFSFHPAGHIPGSAQIRVEHQGEVWVFTGDYKLQQDGVSEPFEPLRCHTFITESTFGLPVYQWQPQREVMNQINDWWKNNAAHGKASVLSAYALGKAQRILRNIDSGIGRIFVHGAIESINKVLRQQGITLPATHVVSPEMKKEEFGNVLVICPPSAIGSPWMKRFGNYSLGIASGWMTLRGAKRRRGADRGFVLSDHVDWNELNTAVRETGAEKIFVTHGYSETYAAYLRERGVDAQAVRTEYDGEVVDAEPVES